MSKSVYDKCQCDLLFNTEVECCYKNFRRQILKLTKNNLLMRIFPG